MPSETVEGNPVTLRVQQSLGHPLPPQTQPQLLACPRCDSTSTKFCYYNNYNLAQPRHFCKSCRRYWTQGGTLRNVPFGGGTRKGATAKRSRATTSSSSSSSSSSSTVTNEPVPTNPVSVLPTVDVSMNENAAVAGGGGSVGGFNFMASSQGQGNFLGLSGYGLGTIPGFDEMGGFGLGRGVWTFPEVGDFGGGSAGNGGPSVVASSGYDTWQLSVADNGLVDAGDSFASTDLAISTPAQGLD